MIYDQLLSYESENADAEIIVIQLLRPNGYSLNEASKPKFQGDSQKFNEVMLGLLQRCGLVMNFGL